MRHRPAQGEDEPPARHADVVNPLIFYPVRAVEFVSVVAQWLTVGWRYHRIKKRVIEDPASKTYVDDATRPTTVEEAENDELVAAFADKIPDTYGAPKRQPVTASVSGAGGANTCAYRAAEVGLLGHLMLRNLQWRWRRASPRDRPPPSPARAFSMTATRVKSVRRGKNHNEFKGRPALVRERSRVQSSLAAPLHAIDLATRSAAYAKN